MFTEKDYPNRMDFPLHNIYIDIRERGRALSFTKYLHSLKHTVVDGMNRITTSNNEYFFYDKIKQCTLLNGDFYYNGVLFEFKTYKDLLTSINGKDKRLNQQVDDVLKNPSIQQYYIISPCLSEYNFKYNKADRNEFENIKNFFNQFKPFGIDFIPTTSEELAFRDMINIWRSGQSPNNLFKWNYKYPNNRFLTTLSMFPCFNHNDITAICNTFPYSEIQDVERLTEDDLLKVKFGRKKRFDKNKISLFLEQKDIIFPIRSKWGKLQGIVSKIEEIEKEV